MPPPLEASQTFSFHRPTMPSRLSDASFRKQEIGSPRSVPPFDSTRGRRHEPHPAHVVVDALGVPGVVAVARGNAGEQILEVFSRHQIAVGQRRAAEIGQQGIPRAVNPDLMMAPQLHCIEHVRTSWIRLSRPISVPDRPAVKLYIAQMPRPEHHIVASCCARATILTAVILPPAWRLAQARTGSGRKFSPCSTNGARDRRRRSARGAVNAL